MNVVHFLRPMQSLFNISSLFLCALLTASEVEQAPVLDTNQTNAEVAASNYKIKVLLHEQAIENDNHSKIGSSSGFILLDPQKKEQCIKTADKELVVRISHEGIFLNNHLSKKKIIQIKPKEGHLSFNEREYHGDILLIYENKKFFIVNMLHLEEYIVSVLRTESWPGWPLEVNKALAIACRTYAIAMVGRSKKSNLPYHIRNTNLHQTYSGVHSNQLLRQAVQETEGVFLMHDNKPILAMFDGCCGGIIPAHIKDFDFTQAPYLARTYPCTYCKKSKMYSWKAEFELSKIQERLADHWNDKHVLRDFRIVKKDKAGLVNELLCKGSRFNKNISGKKIYSLFDEIKSYCFTVDRKGNKVIITGRGRGHHIGLCQWGARHMVEDSWDYKGILNYYYPGTQLARLH